MLAYSEPRHGPWTVADIGGTHARLARWTAARGLEAPLRLSNDDYSGPLAFLAEWFERCSDEPRQVLLALAMPAAGDAGTLTNRAWRIEPATLAQSLRLDRLIIVNDFAAAAAGIDALPADQVRLLNPGDARAVTGVRLVLGPGTGLGTAAILADHPPRVLASEAGHITFGSTDSIATRLHAAGGARWGRVSWERVLCGEGLAWLHAENTGRDDGGSAAGVARAAEAGDAAARATVALFSRLLGEFAGDACLAFQALEGVYLCGGVLDGVRETFDSTGFLDAFVAKGRFADALRKVPVRFAAGHELGLHGAARYLARRCRLPTREWER